MRLVAVVVEGQTEEQFVAQILQLYALQREVHLQPVVVKTSRPAGRPAHKGGGTWTHYRRDINKLLAGHFSIVTTMIDFYAYPKDAPGYACCPGTHTPKDCVRLREQAMADVFSNRRFLPNIVLHEFETLVMAAAVIAGHLLGDSMAAEKLERAVTDVGGDVELVNDGPNTAPSRRVIDAMPGYTKAVDGVAAIEDAGLAAVLDKCERLRDWVERVCAAEPPSGSG